MHRPKSALVLSSLLAAAVATACGGGGHDGDNGTLAVHLTDAPGCGYDAVFVTVTGVRVHRSETAGDTDAGWQDVPMAAPRRIDLLSLSNGLMTELGSRSIEPGSYRQIRLILGGNGSDQPLANAVVPTGGSALPLDTPSAQQSGLKVRTPIEVSTARRTDVVLDFDACRSVVANGATGRYHLKPVLAALPMAAGTTQSVEGFVVPALGGGLTEVSLQAAGIPVRATIPDATGRFLLAPVPVGNYDLVIRSPGRVLTVIGGVPSTSLARTVLNSAVTALDPPASPSRRITSTVTAPTLDAAAIRVTQTVAGSVIELTNRPVDPQTGQVVTAVASGDPIRASFGAQTGLTFSADPAAAGLFAVQASVSGADTQTQPADVRDGDSALSFAF